jgi:hypothetical protein
MKMRLGLLLFLTFVTAVAADLGRVENEITTTTMLATSPHAHIRGASGGTFNEKDEEEPSCHDKKAATAKKISSAAEPWNALGLHVSTIISPCAEQKESSVNKTTSAAPAWTAFGIHVGNIQIAYTKVPIAKKTTTAAAP